MDIYTRVHLNYKRYLRDEFRDLAVNEPFIGAILVTWLEAANRIRLSGSISALTSCVGTHVNFLCNINHS